MEDRANRLDLLTLAHLEKQQCIAVGKNCSYKKSIPTLDPVDCF
jgi:hypothetical protein